MCLVQILVKAARGRALAQSRPWRRGATALAPFEGFLTLRGEIPVTREVTVCARGRRLEELGGRGVWAFVWGTGRSPPGPGRGGRGQEHVWWTGRGLGVLMPSVPSLPRHSRTSTLVTGSDVGTGSAGPDPELGPRDHTPTLRRGTGLGQSGWSPGPARQACSEPGTQSPCQPTSPRPRTGSGVNDGWQRR